MYLQSVVVADPESGVFMYSHRRRSRADLSTKALTKTQSAEIALIQLWAPHDYVTSPFCDDALPDGWDAQAVAMAWIIDEQGEERELNLSAGDFDEMRAAEVEVFGDSELPYGLPLSARLTALTSFPADAPPAIVEGVRARHGSRKAAERKKIEMLDRAIGKVVWLRLFGGEAVGGKLKEVEQRKGMIRLENPKRLGFPISEWSNDRVPVRMVAHACVSDGPWTPKELMPTSLNSFLEVSDPPVCTGPQLWSARCPKCAQVVRSPWRTAGCWSCCSGRVRDSYFDVSDDVLLGLLERRAESQELAAVVEQRPDGCWRAALKTPAGEFIRTFLSNMVSRSYDRRQAIIELLELAQREGFCMTSPDSLWATGPEWHRCGRQAPSTSPSPGTSAEPPYY